MILGFSGISAESVAKNTSALARALKKHREFHAFERYTITTWAKPIEFNPRMGGGSIIELVSVMNAADLQGMALSKQLAKLKLNRVLLTTVIQPRSGKRIRIVEYRGLSEVERQPDVVFVKKIVQVGAIVTATDREVYLIEFCVSALTAEAAKQRARALKDSIQVFAEEVISA